MLKSYVNLLGSKFYWTQKFLFSSKHAYDQAAVLSTFTWE